MLVELLYRMLHIQWRAALLYLALYVRYDVIPQHIAVQVSFVDRMA